MLISRRLATYTLGAILCSTTVVAGMTSSNVAEAGNKKAKKYLTPDPFDGFMVFVGDGEIPANEAPAANASTFFTDIMCWGEQEFADWMSDRFAILEDRFGLDLAAAEASLSLTNVAYADSDLFIAIVHTNPDLDYRAVAVGDRAVPQEGWVNREGAIQIVVTNPNGITLGGEFAGVHVPAGGFFAAGIYNVEVTDKHGPTGEELVLNFASSIPITPAFDQSFGFSCLLDSDLFANDGLAQGHGAVVPVTRNGNPFLKANFRNILTFTDDDGL